MNLRLLTFATTALFFLPARAAEEKAELKDLRSKASYGVGLSLGTQWKRQSVDDLDLDLVKRGLKDALSGATPLLTEQDLGEVFKAFNAELRVKVENKRKQLVEKNRVEGEKFLTENKTKPGVVALPSGLQYKVLTEGKGVSPGTNDDIVVNYRGTFIDGTEFDSSFKTGQPATFNINGVIPGWTEAFRKMKVGSKWQLFIPPQLAYGETGRPNIAPNSTLIFGAELLEIKPFIPPPAPPVNQPVTSDIIKVPSAEELKKGAQIEIIKPDQIDKLKKDEKAPKK